jgi:hypothetical protein
LVTESKDAASVGNDDDVDVGGLPIVDNRVHVAAVWRV